MSAIVVTTRRGRRFDYADLLLGQLRAVGLPLPEREYRPFDDRKFRLDCAWPLRRVFVECDGGEYLRAQSRRHGGAADCERWNLLALAGWTGFRFVGSQILRGDAVALLEKFFEAEPVRATR